MKADNIYTVKCLFFLCNNILLMGVYVEFIVFRAYYFTFIR